MKRLISMLVTASMLSPVFTAPKITHAAPWITVSSWAYNSVSNFKNAGLLPESFEEVEDYTQNITRIQFAELLRNALVMAGCMKHEEYRIPYTSYEFTDTENTAAAELAGYGLMQGEAVKTEKIKTGTGSTVKVYNAFYPDRLLTREEMAAVIYRAAVRWSGHMLTASQDGAYTEPTDEWDISLWAKESVHSLQKANIISGMGDGSFAPKNNLTIEQAIQVIYCLYNEIPATHEADGANIREEGEQTVKAFENGLSETKDGNVLNLKNGDTTLMQFETDIYSHVYSATVNGIVYAAAQNVYEKTDFYNAETGELIFKIQRPVYKLTSEYIITKSANVGAVTFGVCDYSGNEILPPEYSLTEIDVIKANGWTVPEEEKQPASGWIYYEDEYDRHIYRIDSNGENKQLVSAQTVNDGSLHYLNNRVYFLSGGLLISVKPDGSDEKTMNLPRFYNDFLETRYGEYYFLSDGMLHTLPDYIDSEFIGGKRIMSRIPPRQRLFTDGEAIYLDTWDRELHFMDIYRVTVTNGGMDMEKVTEGRHITDYRTKDGRIYFVDHEPSAADEDGYATYGKLYCAEDGKVTLVCDKMVDYFNFYHGEIAASVVEDDINNQKKYLMDMNGGNMRLWKEWETAYNKYSSNGKLFDNMYEFMHIYEELSDESYMIYSVEHTSGDRERTLYCSDAAGDSSVIYTESIYSETKPDKRIGNILYYNTKSGEEESRGGLLHAYNMDTKESSVVSDEVYDVVFRQNVDGSDWLTYTDYNGNIWRYNGVSGACDEIFPCKGIKKYGVLQSIAEIDGVYYKADVDGNYSFLTDADVYFDCVYVENGSENGIGFYG